MNLFEFQIIYCCPV